MPLPTFFKDNLRKSWRSHLPWTLALSQFSKWKPMSITNSDTHYENLIDGSLGENWLNENLKGYENLKTIKISIANFQFGF